LTRRVPPRRLDLDDLQGDVHGVGVAGFHQYCKTKLMNVLFATELQRRADNGGLAGLRGKLDVVVFHPGAVQSQLGTNVAPRVKRVVSWLLRPLFRSPAMGAVLGLHAVS